MGSFGMQSTCWGLLRNVCGLNGADKLRGSYANRIIDECEAAWKKLVRGKAKHGDISL
jgi:hypothetical protein